MRKKLLTLLGFILLLSPVNSTELGLLSDTIPGVLLHPAPGSDSFLGLYSGSNISDPIVDDPGGAVDFREAPKSFKVIFTTRLGRFQGWFIQWGNPGTPESVHRDMTAYHGGSIRFWMKAHPNLAGQLDFGIRTAFIPPGSEASKIDLDQYLNDHHGGYNAFDNQWHSIAIPVAFIAGANQEWADLSRMKVLANFAARDGVAGAKEFFIDKLRWDTEIPGNLASIVVLPSPVDVPINSGQVFTATGFDSGGVKVDIWPDWTTDVAGSSFDTTPSDVVFFTAGPTETTGLVTATEGGISGSADVTLTPSVGIDQEEYGVLTDTIEGVVFPDNAAFGVFPSHVPLSQFQIQPNNVDVREPSQSHETTVSTNGTAGWFVQHGQLGSPDTETLNMSGFAGGTLRFWFKGDPGLQDLMTVGIRSGNVPAGTETSSVNLRDHVTFNNQWHSVTIPLSLFAGAPPKANLGSIKTLVSFTVSGNTNGQRKFFVDKIRWDARTPGALNRFEVTPVNVSVPTDSIRKFEARAFDAADVEIDTWPTWTKIGLGGSSLSSTEGNEIQLQAGPFAETGSLRADIPGANDSTNVTVEEIQFNQSVSVYSDDGFLRDPGVAPNTPGLITLSPGSPGVPDDPIDFFRCTYDLVITPEVQNPFAVWFVAEPLGETEFMQAYATGFLEFYVRTQKDLFFSIRSDNIPAGTEGKIWLSDLGIPLDNQWQKVVVSLDSFPNIEFDKIVTFFAIGTESQRLGGIELDDEVFDVDDVKWLTNVRPPNADDVLQGLLQKQRPSGLVRSFGSGTDPAPLATLQQAVTYDNALAAQVYLYNKRFTEARAIFDAYQSIGHAANGFWDEYHVDDFTNLGTLLPDQDRLAGPNAWLLNALIQHKALTGSTAYDTMMSQLANWLLSLQDPGDGAVQFGFADSSNVPPGVKSTEHNLDAYAVFRSYAAISGNAAFDTAADAVLNWLTTPASSGGAWNQPEQRFNTGENQFGGPDTQKALDIYAWAPLALDEDESGLPLTALLPKAEAEFRNIQENQLTGFDVDGFDFWVEPAGQPDAVWLEGTGHMVVAYQVTGSSLTADFFINELNKAVITISDTVQALTYATNGGSGFGGFSMDSVNQSASSMAWYLFAQYKYNPFKPLPGFTAEIFNISNNQVHDKFEWSGVTAAQTQWARSDQYMKIFPNPASTDAWGIQIFTDNTPTSNDPHFQALAGVPSTSTLANPMGLLLNLPGNDPTHRKLEMAWSVKPRQGDLPPAFDPSISCPDFQGPPEAFQWHFFTDQGTPATDLDGDGQVGGQCDGSAFADLSGEDPVIVVDPRGFHGVQGPLGYFERNGPIYLYIQANFSNALAAQDYKTHITLEYFTE